MNKLSILAVTALFAFVGSASAFDGPVPAEDPVPIDWNFDNSDATEAVPLGGNVFEVNGSEYFVTQTGETVLIDEPAEEAAEHAAIISENEKAPMFYVSGPLYSGDRIDQAFGVVDSAHTGDRVDFAFNAAASMSERTIAFTVIMKQPKNIEIATVP
jgi:hypothetical protein